jgi:Domain of unknown function DUF11
VNKIEKSMQLKEAFRLSACILFCASAITGCGGGGSANPSNFDLVLSAIKSPDSSSADDIAAYTIKVRNDGPSTANNVTFDVSVSVDAGLNSPVECLGRGGAVCPTSNSATSVIPSIPSGGEIELTYRVKFDTKVNVVARLLFEAQASGEINTDNNQMLVATKLVNTNVSMKPTELRAGSLDAKLDVAASADTFAHKVVITNSGQNPTAVSTLGFKYKQTGVENTLVNCTAVAGAICPGPVSENQVLLPAIPPGGRLDLTLHLTAPITSRETLIGDIFL